MAATTKRGALGDVRGFSTQVRSQGLGAVADGLDILQRQINQNANVVQNQTSVVPPAIPASTRVVAVGPSPFTYAAGGSSEILYISGGFVTSIIKLGVNITGALPLTVFLAPGARVVITYVDAPTVVADIQSA